jgi:hypothetical protein
MSCDECDRIQDLAFNKNKPESCPIAYVRVGRANIAIVGCAEHLKDLCDALRKVNK